jgi:hypothetical protein
MKPLRSVVSLLFCLPVLATLTGANVSRQVSHQNLPEMKEQRLWASYFSVEKGFSSTLEIKNNRIKDRITAHISLYFSNGEESYLEPVDLGPRQTAVIDLNRAMRSLTPSIAARVGNEGSVEVEFEATTPSAVMGGVSVINEGKGIAWNFVLYPTSPLFPVAPLRGVFWFHNQKTKGFVVAHNGSNSVATARPRFEISGKTYPLAARVLQPGQGMKLDLRAELEGLGLADVAEGGVEIAYDGEPDALKAHGVLFDGKGLSAEIDFYRSFLSSEPQTFAFRTPRFATGEADPRLELPPSTTFEPILALHNFDSRPLPLDIAIRPDSSTNNQDESVQQLVIAPGETRIVRLDKLLEENAEKRTHWASLEIKYVAVESILGASLVSISSNEKFSIRSVLNWIETTTREGWYWRADEKANTFLAIYNTDYQAADVDVSLDYYVGNQRRSHPLQSLKIEGRTSVLIDIGRHFSSANERHDADFMSHDVRYGGYRVKQSRGRQNSNIVTEALIFERGKRSFLSIYNTGCCETPAVMDPAAFQGTPGNLGPFGIYSTDECTWEQLDYSSLGAHYTIDDFNVADVLQVGPPIPMGRVRYNSPGQTNIEASITHNQYWYGTTGGCRRQPSISGCSVSVYAPTVSFGSLLAVGKDQTATISVTVSPPSTVSFSLFAETGTGAAKFVANGQASLTMYVSGSTNLSVRGETESSTAGNMRISAHSAMGDEYAITEFTVIRVDLALRTGGSVSFDNSAFGVYSSAMGTSSLGTFFSTGSSANHWRTGVEIIGAVLPNNFPNAIVLEREVVSHKRYKDASQGSTLVETLGPFSDTSDPLLRDDNPQSGGSAGKVYDLDAPSLSIAGADPVGTISRNRTNFRQWATLNGVRVSGDLTWYSVKSVMKTANGIELNSLIANDNVAMAGITLLSWNLQ